MSAFGIGTARFAVGTRCVACGTLAAGLFATLGIWCTVAGCAVGLCVVAAGFTARGAFGTCAIAGLLAIARTVGFTAGCAVMRALGIAGPLTIARGACWFAGVAVARGKIACADFTRRRSKAIARGKGRRRGALSAISLARSTGRREWGTIAIATHGARQRRRHEFIEGEFAVVIFVERAQRLGGAGDFVFGDHAIVIFVEGRDDGWHRRVLASAGATGRTVGQRTGFAGRRSRRGAFRRLCICQTRRQCEGERDDDWMRFHGLVFGLVVDVFLFWNPAAMGSRTHESPRRSPEGSFLKGTNHVVVKRVCVFGREIVKKV